jgi:hypothetical protein
MVDGLPGLQCGDSGARHNHPPSFRLMISDQAKKRKAGVGSSLKKVPGTSS